MLGILLFLYQRLNSLAESLTNFLIVVSFQSLRILRHQLFPVRAMLD